LEDKYVVEGGNALRGTVCISGSKNASLPILAASLLTADKCVISGIPCLADIHNMIKMIVELGGQISYQGNQATVQVRELRPTVQVNQHARKMRASFLVMGPLLVRLGEASMPLPGGCAIGARPVDLHLKGLVALGAEVKIEKGYVQARAGRLTGADIHLDFPSVGATENIIMAACGAKGTTRLGGAAREPEIVDLANFLNSMGAQVRGAGSPVITIQGREFLHGAMHTVIPDRIEAGTYMVAAVATGGEVRLRCVIPMHLRAIINKLRETGAEIEEELDEILVSSSGQRQPVVINTSPYPGFPTDMQPQFAAMMATASGQSLIEESVFDRRFLYLEELRRMGACIETSQSTAVIRGVNKLSPARVGATDLRAGAALVIAALQAGGESEINYCYHLDRGYEDLERKLTTLGAKIRRVSEKAANL
jgi:UDP-N-acetylglucosamine 1-carboxyvinyltransferase